MHPTSNRQRITGYVALAITASVMYMHHPIPASANDLVNPTPVPTLGVPAPLNAPLEQAGDQLNRSVDKGMTQITRIRPMEAPVQPMSTNTNNNVWGWGWLGLLGLTGLFGLFRPTEGNRGTVSTNS